jgi:hypothetical protein
MRPRYDSSDGRPSSAECSRPRPPDGFLRMASREGQSSQQGRGKLFGCDLGGELVELATPRFSSETTKPPTC